MLKRKGLHAAILGLGFILIFLSPARAATDETGAPVSGLAVSIENKEDGGNKTAARTDAEGNFSLSGLKPGTYKLRMSCGSCQYAGQRDAGKSDNGYEQKYLFYVTVEGAKQRKFKKTVELKRMLSGVEYTIKIEEGSKGEITGKVTGDWNRSNRIKPPTE
jgi:hypothetical protein